MEGRSKHREGLLRIGGQLKVESPKLPSVPILALSKKGIRQIRVSAGFKPFDAIV